jgi:hypothetical protein
VREIAADEQQSLQNILQPAQSVSQSKRVRGDGRPGDTESLLSTGTLELASEAASLRERSANGDHGSIENVSLAPSSQLSKMMNELPRREP